MVEPAFGGLDRTAIPFDPMLPLPLAPRRIAQPANVGSAGCCA
jgi:hypothetical protein